MGAAEAISPVTPLWDNGRMFTDRSAYEFSPADIEMFVKWFGWTSPPTHINNDADLLDRETWYWVSHEALDALNESLWSESQWQEAPILLPEDLPSPDGIMVFANPLMLPEDKVDNPTEHPIWEHPDGKGEDGKFLPDAIRRSVENTLVCRWTSTSEYLITQHICGTSLNFRLHRELQRRQLVEQKPLGTHTQRPKIPADSPITYDNPPELQIRPDTWRDITLPPATFEEGYRHTPFTCIDGSPLALLFGGARIWQWGRRSDTTKKYDNNEALRLVQTGLRASEVMPLLWPLPNEHPVLEHADPEMITLPDERQLRHLVSSPPLSCDPTSAIYAQLLHCLWAFASKPLPANAPRHITRDIAKSRRFSNRATGGLRVMTLREEGEHQQTTTDGQNLRNRPRRHLVRGHWRRQWYPSIETHRIMWIAPHLRAGRPSDPPSETSTRTVRRVAAPAEQQGLDRVERANGM